MGVAFVVEPALIAIAIGAVLSVLLVVPLIAVQYRQWGTLSFGRLFLILAFMLYLIAIPMYTLLPTGIDIAAVCARDAGAATQLRPFQFVADVRAVVRVDPSPQAVLTSATVQQVLFNVLLFVPLGVFLRRLNRLSWWAVLLAGVGTSLLIEFTQLTGNWGFSECAYRVFDVDDLILNTTGTAIGLIIAPLLNVVPGVHLREADRERVRPINRKRRLVQLFCDWLSFTLLTAAIPIGINLVDALLNDAAIRAPSARLLAGTDLAVGAVLFVLIPLLLHGETLGERIVLVSVKTPEGRDPTAWPIVVKALTGWVPFVLFGVLGRLGVPGMNLLGLLWIGFTIAFLMRRPEGFSMMTSGLRRFDDRVNLPPN